MGVNPTRSRRCKRRVLTVCHWETGKAVRRVDEKPGDLPISSTHPIPTWK